MKWIVGGGIGIGVVLLWMRSTASKIEKNIEYKFSNPRVRFGFNTEVDLDLEVTNLNNVDVRVVNFSGHLIYGTKKLGTITAPGFDLSSGQTNGTVVTVELRLLDVANNILQLIQSGNYLNELKVKGVIRLKHPQTGINVNVPYDEKVI